LSCRIFRVCSFFPQSTIGNTANPPYAEARKIYVDGRHSFKNDGTIRTLRGEGRYVTSVI
jgi:hypothetical protein